MGGFTIAEVICIRGFSALPQQSPAPVFDSSLLLNVILLLCIMTKPFLELATAVWSAYVLLSAGLFLCHVTA